MAFSGKNGVNDLVLLSQVTEDAIKDNLKKRYNNGECIIRDAWRLDLKPRATRSARRNNVVSPRSPFFLFSPRYHLHVHWQRARVGQSVQKH